MLKKISMLLLTLVLAIVTLLIAASKPTGPNTVSFDDPVGLWTSLGMLIVLFLPPLILSLFNHLAVKIISAIYQGFIVLTFFGLILVGLILPSVPIIVLGLLGVATSICSIIVTVSVGLKKERLLTNS
ncbi:MULTISPECIES: hypothetical protein [Ornithinibacillus]|uniref:DUF5391 family protein n=2 Tax=Ornithinibacillus TaxID=484508 RepID=A0A923L516_9BACI|nr:MULTISPECIES: hypothetical protein [Ornithinibacillus]MBC5636602.1 hypothetical protein [Ornithinibacillus hominis]MBS3680556.1 hypothetical protein [Ornithinibacillus massiliensis]